MKFYFHGMKAGTEVEMEPGNLITYMKVDGSRSTGILMDWEVDDVFPRSGSITFTVLLETGVVATIGKGMIFWCEVIS
jgi:hypothetical protein